ncbi:MerR family transcriptional regulator [Solihabitans fulvus]|uniref:MerR family transcriptional regulator n=1 Tax=Solihabitans fulvus TaxID=1892852 RepID=A0A5B2XFS6_9PSEU|nr:MerR family transcriptional regulator [Solihabitans fulvus]KAA2261770.1 MerR family transcriptional regulator [Solihabitans fulvus]
MFTIGDFARLGLVSVRMLRHYDAIGLLRPARVDQATGYRFYEAAQLATLNRVIALKDLGFTLNQVGEILAERVTVEELHGMLRLRRADLETRIAADRARLTGVEARLRTIESEGRMPAEEVLVKHVPAIRVAELSGVAASYGPEDIGPVIGPLFDRLCGIVEESGVPLTGPGLAYYVDVPGEDDAVTVHTAIPVSAEPGAVDGVEIKDLPGIGSAATIVHRGPMHDAGPTFQALAEWIDANGYLAVGHAREISLECPRDDLDKWVTEFQIEITPAS